MIFFRQKPRCKDIDYIENIFGIIFDSYPNYIISNSKLNSLPKIENRVELIKYLEQICIELNLNANFQYINTEHEDVNDTPISIIGDISNPDLLIININNLGSQIIEITIVETILYLMSFKIFKENSIEFDDEIRNMENFYEPFLVCLSIYFGYGEHLLLRNWVSGNYNSTVVKYFVRLDLDNLIYAFSLISFVAFKTQKTNLNLKTFSKNIQQEINICWKYFEKGNSEFVNFYLAKKEE